MSARPRTAAVAFAFVLCLALPGVAAAQQPAPAPVELWKTYPLNPTGGQAGAGEEGAENPGSASGADASGSGQRAEPSPGAESQAQSRSPADEGVATGRVLVIVGVVLVLLVGLVAVARPDLARGGPRALAPHFRARIPRLARSARRVPDGVAHAAPVARSVAAAAERVSRKVQTLPEASARVAGLGHTIAATSVRAVQAARPGRLELATAGPSAPNGRSDVATEVPVADVAGAGGRDEPPAPEVAGERSPDAAAREEDDPRVAQEPKRRTRNEELVTLKAKARVGARARPDVLPAKEAQGDDRDDVEILKEKAARSKRAKTRSTRPKRASAPAKRETPKQKTAPAPQPSAPSDAPAEAAAGPPVDATTGPPPELAAEPAPAECEIVWWRGFSTSQFLAVSGDDLVASSPFFASSQSNQPPKTREAVRALESLLETLERDGWSVGDRGREWFRIRMRHTASPKSVGRLTKIDW